MGAALRALHQYQQLLLLYSRKFQLAQQSGSRALIASAQADTASVYQLKHQYREAETLYHKALSTYHSIPNKYREGDMLLRLAYLSLEQGREVQAISFLEDAIPPAPSSAFSPLSAPSWHNFGKTHQAQIRFLTAKPLSRAILICGTSG